LVDLPPVDPEVRRELEASVVAEGAPALHARLAAIDPITADTVHPNDALRIVRALEGHRQTGTPLGTLRAKHALGQPRYRAVFVALDLDREAHDRIIGARIQSMLDRGWLDEVKSLRARWKDEVRPFGSVGYRELLGHLRGEMTLEEARRHIRKSTRTYARRQRTWFRGEQDVHWWTELEQLLGPEMPARVERELGR
jgi:tRNA dimethylallyltransferase